MKPVPHFSVANIRISEQTTKFYLSFFTRKMPYRGTEPDWFCYMRCLDCAQHDNVVVDARNEWSLRALPLLLRFLGRAKRRKRVNLTRTRDSSTAFGMTLWISLSRLIRPILCFEDGAWFVYFYRMPHPFGYLDSINSFSWTYTEPRCLCETTLIRSHLTILYWAAGIHIWEFFIEHPIQAALQTHNTLTCIQMPMYCHICSRL